MNEIMTIKNLSAFYGSKEALHDITASVERNRITAIIGPSGCGKSTLLRCMNGTLSQEAGASFTGEICLEGENIADMRKEELCRRVGLVFQTPAPFPFSIEKNMGYALKYYGKKRSEIAAITEEKLRLAGLYDEVKNEMGKSALQLSGGQKQRLCIARALTVEPDILLLDEPCSALDVNSSRTIEELLLELKEKYTFVIVTHNLAQAKRIADRVIFLYNGELTEENESGKFFDAPQSERARAFLSGAFG
ncbi:MAG: phosphate ABC transporter ATP-binding protein [Eubacteriales bacterium]|nr:phosphate ABC transporter ATP-binding protein [Eubacteriales bacterium]